MIPQQDHNYSTSKISQQSPSSNQINLIHKISIRLEHKQQKYNDDNLALQIKNNSINLIKTYICTEQSQTQQNNQSKLIISIDLNSIISVARNSKHLNMYELVLFINDNQEQQQQYFDEQEQQNQQEQKTSQLTILSDIRSFMESTNPSTTTVFDLHGCYTLTIMIKTINEFIDNQNSFKQNLTGQQVLQQQSNKADFRDKIIQNSEKIYQIIVSKLDEIQKIRNNTANSNSNSNIFAMLQGMQAEQQQQQFMEQDENDYGDQQMQMQQK